MNRNLLLGVAFLSLASLATAGPRGTVPKTSADQYPAYAEHDGTKIGASLMSPNEVRKVFGFDVDRSCIIVEVALYPPDNKERKMLLSDFSLRIAGTDTAVKPSGNRTHVRSLGSLAEHAKTFELAAFLHFAVFSNGF